MKLIISIAIILSALSIADDSIKADMKQSLSIFEMSFRALYAPREWKAKFAGWNLAAEIENAKKKIDAMETVSLRKYHTILNQLFNSTQDYHTSIRFLSTETAFLPFHVRGAAGKYYIVALDRSKLTKMVFPFEIGDEVIEFGDIPVAKAVEAIKTELGPNTPTTQQALAEYYLTQRTRASGMVVPQGSINIKVKPKGRTEVYGREINWIYTPDKVPSNSLPKKSKSIRSLLHLQMGLPDFGIDKKIEGDENPFMLGSKNGFVPDLGKVIWTSDGYFQAYIFETIEGKKIGFLRIPHYTGTIFTVSDFARLLTKFQEEVDSLVIDQTNNPGGYVYYLYALASMLTDQAMTTPLHRIAVTKQDVLYSEKLLEEISGINNDEDARGALGPTIQGYPVTHQTVLLIKSYCNFVISEYQSGRRLTNPTHLLAVKKLNPHPVVTFTKPILVLINELDFSGGDFFPAILQDNGRATIMGTRTAGAGGYVVGVEIPNDFGILGFRMTGSLAERVNQQPLENLGVIPDIQYTFTPNDLQNNFIDYKNAILEALKKLKSK